MAASDKHTHLTTEYADRPAYSLTGMEKVDRGLTCVSLFSGAGGLDVGAHSAGFRTVAAVEYEARYAQTLSDNAWLAHATVEEFDCWFDAQLPSHGTVAAKTASLVRERLRPAVGRPNAMSDCRVINADIADVSTAEVMSAGQFTVGELDLIIGGPPCQSFSKAGQRMSIEDLRGQLFLHFARFVRELRPRWFLFENVKGLTNSKAVIVTATCKSCGVVAPSYEEVLTEPGARSYPCPRCGASAVVESRCSDSRGALQVIVNEFESLGYTCHVHLVNALDFGVPQSRERLFILGSRDGDSPRRLIPTHSLSSGNPAVRQLSLLHPEEIAPLPAETVWSTLFANRFNPYHHNSIDPDRAVLWVKNVVRPHDEPVTWDLRRPSPTIGAHQGAKLAIAPFGVPEEQLLRQQWHTLGKRQGDTPPVAVTHTYLSDQDLLTLQSFPSDWYIGGTRMERAFQIGNAVPPRLAAAVLGRIPEARQLPTPSGSDSCIVLDEGAVSVSG